MGYSTVVEEVISTPVTAVVAIAGVSPAIVDSAIEANVAAPVSPVEAIASAIEDPIARCPESAGPWRGDPYSRDPVVACRGIPPVAGCPHIVRLRRRRLIVFRQWWRSLICFQLLVIGFVVRIDLTVVVGGLLLLIVWLGLLLIGRRRPLLLSCLLILLGPLNALVLDPGGGWSLLRLGLLGWLLSRGIGRL